MFVGIPANHRQRVEPVSYTHLDVYKRQTYLCTVPYNSAADASVRWNDAKIAVDWPVTDPLLSHKDAMAPFLEEIAEERLPVYGA